MNFVVSSTGLLKKLQLLSGVLNSSNTLPILDNFLFDVNKDRIMISASDLETTLTTSVEAKSKEEFKICIPARLLIPLKLSRNSHLPSILRKTILEWKFLLTSVNTN